jgi:hypothetical protein
MQAEMRGEIGLCAVFRLTPHRSKSSFAQLSAWKSKSMRNFIIVLRERIAGGG